MSPGLRRDEAVDSGPYDLAPHGGTGRAGVLCLHGLTGTPYEVRPLAEALAKRGIRARGPVLPGHDTTPEDLAHVSHTAWLEAARDELVSLRRDHERVFVAGLSMGGLLTLALGAEGRADALAAVATPLRLRPRWAMHLIPLMKRVYPFLPKRDGSDIRDPAARARHPGYQKMPLRSVHELIRLQRLVVPQLRHIHVPILVAHGAHDRTAHPDDARRIAADVSSDDLELHLLEESAHVVPVDFDGEKLADAVATFLDRRA